MPVLSDCEVCDQGPERVWAPAVLQEDNAKVRWPGRGMKKARGGGVDRRGAQRGDEPEPLKPTMPPT